MANPVQPTVAVPREPEALNVVQTPTSPSSAFTLCRFEFETGTKGNEGTKILMVEWDPTGTVGGDAKKEHGEAAGGTEKNKEELKPSAHGEDDWEVSWEGKDALTALPIRDADAARDGTLRVYFLLPSGAPIPTLVTITEKTIADTKPQELRTKPLPAIFPDGLVNSEKGARGVLHTIWAKKRLEQLEMEIVSEMKENGESVGLEMALQERQWIVDHFGLSIDTSSVQAIPLKPHGTESPVSPRSPIGGRLGEKLRGLKLATSPAELAAAKQASKSNTKQQPSQRQITSFTPDSGNAGAATSFSGFPARPAAASTGVASLNAVMESGPNAAPLPEEKGGDTEEDLFALPMSPRSPEMAKSPFSLLKS